jgi:hypothetical protein
MELNPQQWYNQERSKIDADIILIRRKIKVISTIRLALFTAILLAILFLYQHNYLFGSILFALSLTAFLFALKRSLEQKKKLHQSETALKIIQLECNALMGKPSGQDIGADLLDLKHPFAHDLDLFGKHSLWHYINRTLTFDGRMLLADALLNPQLNKEELIQKQAIVSELKNQPETLLHFRVHGLSEQENPAPASQIENWLNEEISLSQKPLIRYGRWIFSAIALISILGFAFNFLPGWCLSTALTLNFIMLGTTIKQINFIHQKHSGIVKTIAHHEALLAYVSQLKFEHLSLSEIQNDAQHSLQAIKNLHRALNRFDVRLNGFMGIVMNIVFMFDYHCLVEIETWKNNNRNALQKSLKNMATMEYSISLANFAFQRPNFNFPQFTSQDSMQAEGLFHPLLHAEKAVSNTLSLGENEKMVLLTGANMTGKSTWLRAIGLNATLAYLGLPIAAKSAQFPLLRIYTSMRITDDLEEGISYFKAEISRLQALLTSIRNSEATWLFLIDEPLRGTNAGDKQAGTIGIIKNLITLNAVGILASHDAALSNLETENPGKIKNYHFDSEIIGNELSFDYTLKSGCSTSNNATLLMKLNGILLD